VSRYLLIKVAVQILQLTVRNTQRMAQWLTVCCYYYYYYLLQFSCHSVAAVLTLEQTKQIRINIHKRNNTKAQYKQYKNTVNTSTHTTKTPSHTYTHLHIRKQFKTTTVQVKTNTVQDIPKWNSHNTIKYRQYNITLMYIALLSPRISPLLPSLHFT